MIRPLAVCAALAALSFALPASAAEPAPSPAPQAQTQTLDAHVRALARHMAANDKADAGAYEQTAVATMHQLLDAAEKDPSLIPIIHLLCASPDDPAAMEQLHKALMAHFGGHAPAH